MKMYMYMTVPALPFCQVPRFGKPTWKRLVEAVEDRGGGNNPALAQEIAKDHPGVYPYNSTEKNGEEEGGQKGKGGGW